MLYIMLSNKVERSWHLDQPYCNLLDDINLVTEIQADGDELDWVLKNIAGIPYCATKRVMSWYGDHAKFIANCLPKK